MNATLAWLLTGRSLLMALGFGLVAGAVILGAALMAGTPRATLGGDIVPPATPAPPAAPQRYILAEGSTAAGVADQLEALGVIRSATQFNVLASLLGLQNRLASGSYTLTPGASIASIIDQLTVGEAVPTARVTFPEGLRIEEMAAIAEEAGFGTAAEFVAAAAESDLPPGLAAELPEGVGREGYLFPDTYILPLGSTAADLVTLMFETMHQRFSAALREAAAERGLTVHDALALASIIEREIVLASERPIVAGIFFNRLDAGDRLGADATVQYAIAADPASVAEFGWWKPGSEITVTDLEHPSPYNTRLHPGLPPGPIASPGLAAIEAVADPVGTTYYYYVLDACAGDDSHAFAVTFAQHQANIARSAACQ